MNDFFVFLCFSSHDNPSYVQDRRILTSTRLITKKRIKPALTNSPKHQWFDKVRYSISVPNSSLRQIAACTRYNTTHQISPIISAVCKIQLVLVSISSISPLIKCVCHNNTVWGLFSACVDSRCRWCDYLLSAVFLTIKFSWFHFLFINTTLFYISENRQRQKTKCGVVMTAMSSKIQLLCIWFITPL